LTLEDNPASALSMLSDNKSLAPPGLVHPRKHVPTPKVVRNNYNVALEFLAWILYNQSFQSLELTGSLYDGEGSSANSVNGVLGRFFFNICLLKTCMLPILFLHGGRYSSAVSKLLQSPLSESTMEDLDSYLRDEMALTTLIYYVEDNRRDDASYNQPVRKRLARALTSPLIERVKQITASCGCRADKNVNHLSGLCNRSADYSRNLTNEKLCVVCCKLSTLRCGRCKMLYYCTQAHQKQHYSAHSKTCVSSVPTASLDPTATATSDISKSKLPAGPC